jgi:hypothetical protein
VRVVEAFQVVEDGQAGLGAGPEPVPMEQLAFQGGEEALGEGVVTAPQGRSLFARGS